MFLVLGVAYPKKKKPWNCIYGTNSTSPDGVACVGQFALSKDGKGLNSSLNSTESLGTNISRKEFLVLKISEPFLQSKGLFPAEQLSLGTMTKPRLARSSLTHRGLCTWSTAQ